MFYILHRQDVWKLWFKGWVDQWAYNIASSAPNFEIIPFYNPQFCRAVMMKCFQGLCERNSTSWPKEFWLSVNQTLNLSPSEKGACVQLWYHMYGADMGSLNIYQQSQDGKRALIFSQTGDQGQLWRFAQASLLPRAQPYRVSHKEVQGRQGKPTQCYYLRYPT